MTLPKPPVPSCDLDIERTEAKEPPCKRKKRKGRKVRKPKRRKSARIV